MAVLKYKTKEEVPEDLREHAEEYTEGEEKGFRVKVASEKKLKEFRDNNITLREKNEQLTEDYSAVRKIIGLKDDEKLDVDKFGTDLSGLRETQQKVNDGKLSKSEDVEKEVEKRVATMKQSLEDAKNAALQASGKHEQRANELEAKLKRTFIDHAVYQAFADAELGAQPWAPQYALPIAYDVFTVDENNRLIPKSKDGSVLYGESGSEPMSVREWIDTELRKTKTEFFKPSGGGGAGGGGDTAGNTQYGGLPKDEWLKLTPERKLAVANKNLAAERLKGVRR